MADRRKCIGSAKFGIEAHEAPVDDFPAQPSQKGGLGRMCKPHWNQYTSALRKAALARKAAEDGTASEVGPEPVGEPDPTPDVVGDPEPPAKPGRRTRKDSAPETGDATTTEEG